MRLGVLHKISLFLLIAGCNNKQEATGVKTYFDISGFFSSEADRLLKNHTSVEKIVSQNGSSEKKTITDTDWKTEFELFTNSDINKQAWKTSYKMSNDQNSTTYSALDEKLRTRTIRIEKGKDGKPKHIFILNTVKNMLYSTTEELNYYSDSLYLIHKTQRVVILGDNDYKISGLLKNK